MGSQIAAMLAGVGIPVRLLDIVPPTLAAGEFRNKLAATAIANLKRISPSPLLYPAAAELITPGNLEDDLAGVASSDWIIEVVVERLDVKQAVWRSVAELAPHGTILSTNTSGLSCSALAEVLPPEHRRNFLGTHFFNPPRYLKLLELIPVAETDPAVLAFMQEFGERVLGKGVVVCSDTPNFIGNRVGVYGLAVTLRAMEEMGLGVDEVDAITGPALGRPRSATFRTLDLVGLDTFVHVATNIADRTDDPEERELMTLPPYVLTMMERGWLGEKSGQGFYKKLKGAGGQSQILTLDFQSMEYQPKREPHFESLSATGRVKDTAQRIRALVESQDAAGRFAWRILSQVMAFSARKVGEIANGDVNAVDRAMRWGFNWEIGPFEAWNALGVKDSARRMQADAIAIPDWIDSIDRFPVERGGEQPLSFTVLKSDRNNIVKETAGVTLVDLGDEVLGLQMHGPKQSIGEDYIAAARNAAKEVERNWRGMVVSAEGNNFSVGANLMMIVLAAQARQWDLLERACRGLQETNMLLKYLGRPVVVAPFGITLGGGAEIAMHCARTVAAAETYMGLVEIGVGIIPAGGGTKEMAVRSAEKLLSGNSQLPNRPDLISFLGPAFENIALARTSTSAVEARDIGYLRQTDVIVMNGDHLLKRAKDAVLELDRAGYMPAPPLDVPVAGADGRAVLELAAYTLKNGGYASEYDVYLANRLAYVITGGDLPAGTRVPEQYLLDLEREVFLQLVGEPKTQERMTYMLQRGKPLRN